MTFVTSVFKLLMEQDINAHRNDSHKYSLKNLLILGYHTFVYYIKFCSYIVNSSSFYGFFSVTLTKVVFSKIVCNVVMTEINKCTTACDRRQLFLLFSFTSITGQRMAPINTVP